MSQIPNNLAQESITGTGTHAGAHAHKTIKQPIKRYYNMKPEDIIALIIIVIAGLLVKSMHDEWRNNHPL